MKIGVISANLGAKFSTVADQHVLVWIFSISRRCSRVLQGISEQSTSR